MVVNIEIAKKKEFQNCNSPISGKPNFQEVAAEAAKKNGAT
jgi:hypothetical protein